MKRWSQSISCSFKKQQIKIFQCFKNSLTNQNFYFFNSQRILKKLFQNFHRSFISFTIQMFFSNRTFTNSKKMISIVKSLNLYLFNHKFKLIKILKTINTMQIDFLIIRNSTKSLFKINMHKKIKKKITQWLYFNIWSSVNANENNTSSKKWNKKNWFDSTKKNFAEIKKLVIVTKKLNAKTMRQNKRIERIEKLRLRNEIKIIK